MSENEWLAATDPIPLIGFLRGSVSDRKLRLFACGCCRVDGLDRSTPRAASELARAEEAAERNQSVAISMEAGITAPVFVTVGATAFNAATRMCRFESAGDLPTRCTLFRCVMGNPFRPITANPAWLTSTVLALAEGIYADRAFDRMPILADALQDAGCDDAEVLNHCQGPGPHIRGCWVTDMLLGKQ